MTLRQYEYGRDPLQILCDRETAAERRSCKGCKHELLIAFGADKRKVCNSISRKWGKKCSAYAETE